ncbi:hypothetical protein [Cloacibacillus porcorum]|uniref:hypothetical protein n=1 Tax=Cloacibacillus porcorum TaxID=1197717 RepID=UPI002357A930|nr:hypothetical protein [Cloacibacillus porcorum]MCI5864534.1 hypothetical protein [Cloacibacillus porcorum]MDD7650445.1 hypothetical protein [Cloacibacillus porcorum]MDY4094795.1 hypothetical protein [Cloacibacillus porcorum]
MKKIIALFLSVLLLALASAAFAKPAVTDFRNNNYDYSTIKTVLVLPVIYDVSIPQSEAFLKEAAEQRWQEQTLKKQDRFPFLLKTPKDVVDRAAFISGQPAEPMTPQQTAERALVLAADQVDAILTCTVTKCGIGVLKHPGEYVTKYRYVDEPIWRNNRWEHQRVQVPYQEYKEPWEENITQGAVKVELRSAKDNVLIYGETVAANTGADLFTEAPTLTKHIQNIIENAAKRIPVK